MEADPTALVCDVQRFSIHDGPGIRTSVFFKGCPLACRWCQNPETIAFGNQLLHSRADCIACADCVQACPHGAVEMNAGRPVIDRSACQVCLTCVQACPTAALAPAARPLTPAALLAEVLRDADYYTPDGGLTLSGGEPLAQVRFLSAFLPLARAAGLHVVAQTAGHWQPDALAAVLVQVDLFLFDLKVIDEARHRALTGRSNRRILSNLSALVLAGRALEVRMPVVPGHNDDLDNLEKTAALLAGLGIGEITLLACHDLGRAKGAKLDCPPDPIQFGGDARAAVEAAATVFVGAGLRVLSADPA